MPKKNLEVALIACPDNLLDVVYTACRTCYGSDGSIEIFKNVPESKKKKLELISRVISSGHYSTIEHIQLSFAINNISRAATHQLVRHRLMSFSQKSQRYVKEKGEIDYIVPHVIEANKEIYRKFKEHMVQVSNLYHEMVESGIKKEDARAVLPNATSSSLVVSLNLRELIHLANLRLCTRAQLEIRLVVKKMCSLIEHKEPWLREHLVPKCERIGYCNEDNSCGRMKTKNG